MAGIYIHIPYCKQKCSYCDYHFSTHFNSKEQMVQAIVQELILRKNECNEAIETIYFGGGTPSVLTLDELNLIFSTIFDHYSIAENPEITLEANPDDLSELKIKALKSTPINRFSIGVQSFFEEDLRQMNRAHRAEEALTAVKMVQNAGFENITIDLIYGSQTTTDEMWRENLQIALDLQVPHISSYVLTVEDKTLLQHQIVSGKIPDIDEFKQARHFEILVKTLLDNGFEQYEISNFSKPNCRSRHNSNYWNGHLYLGIGPSAHSYDGKNRSWNVSNNSIYIKKILSGELPSEFEQLSAEDRFNELLMIKLRTVEGLDLQQIQQEFPINFYEDLMQELMIHLDNQTVAIHENHLVLTTKGKFLADGIAGDLFRI
ncbi:MAG TPA: radical SAM family heme chaperone HemW [Moheibacter sp.]|nr:radical SAM family heme chaperone HemW [Moheibacter sp.]